MLDREQVRHVAFLARLQLTSEEEAQFTQQLDSILSYVEQLQELDTEGIDPTFHAVDVEQILRADDVNPWPDLDAILDGAPEREEQFFRVPRILGEG